MSNPQQPWGPGGPQGYGQQQQPPQGYGQPPQGYGQQPSPYAATAASLQATGGQLAHSAKGAAVRIGVIFGLSALVIAGVVAKKAFSNRPDLVFLHNVRTVAATVTVNGAPSGSVASTEVLEIPVSPGSYTVVSTFADGQTQTLAFTVPPRESFFEGFRAVGLLGNPFRYASVTVRYPSYGMRPTIAPLTTGPQQFVPLPVGANRETINTSFPRSVSARRGSTVTLTHYCPITADGDVPCLQ
ncbi:MAG: hypothetical protein U0269_37145 [Polyangiales bacterium]